MLVSLIRVVVLLVCLLLWAVVGFLVWVPLLCRSIAVYSAGVLLCTIQGKDASRLAGGHEFAQAFYFEGFENLLHNYERMLETAKGQATALSVDESSWNWAQIALEFISTVVFWSVVGVLVMILIAAAR
jgi:hypothetical protein